MENKVNEKKKGKPNILLICLFFLLFFVVVSMLVFLFTEFVF